MAEDKTPKESKAKASTGAKGPAKKPSSKAGAARKPAAAKATAGAVAATTPEERAAAERSKARSARAAGASDAPSVRAVAKYLRFSARKGRLVVDLIRGKSVADAATALAFSERAAAREVFKVLKSAVANAENNNGMSIDELYVESAFVDEGPTFKRWKPRARGRVDKINKRTCHVTVVVTTAPTAMLEKQEKKSAGRSARVAASKAAAPKADAPKTAKPKSTPKTDVAAADEAQVEANAMAAAAAAAAVEAPAADAEATVAAAEASTVAPDVAPEADVNDTPAVDGEGNTEETS